MCRPRTRSYSEKEMIKLGEEMVAWVMANKPIHLSLWYTIEKDFTDLEWNTFRQRPEFVHYYTKALKLVGYSYLHKDSDIDVRLKDRWQRVYFKDLRESEDQDANDNELRKATALKGEARATEIEKQKVIEEVQRNKRKLK